MYAYEPQPLPEGERKHTLSVFVADESGLINRVAGVFARRGEGAQAGQAGRAGKQRAGVRLQAGSSPGALACAGRLPACLCHPLQQPSYACAPSL